MKNKFLEPLSYRSSRPEMFCKKGVYSNFAKFTGKYLRRLRHVILFKKRLWHRCFLANFAKYLRQKQPPQVFCKKNVLKNFANLTGKHLCCSLFLIKLQAFQHRFFPVKFVKFFIVPVLKNIRERLRLLGIPFLQNTSGGYFRSYI